MDHGAGSSYQTAVGPGVRLEEERETEIIQAHEEIHVGKKSDKSDSDVESVQRFLGRRPADCRPPSFCNRTIHGRRLSQKAREMHGFHVCSDGSVG